MTLDRRDFIRAAGLVSAGGLVAATGACSTSSVSSPPSATRPPVATSRNASAAATSADWAALGKGLAGKLVRPDDSQYSTARLNFNPRFDAMRPAGIAYCENAQDVTECLAFVRRFGLAVTPRCGGHSYVGGSLSPGLVIDVSPMGSIKADTGSGTAVIGAGARMVDVYGTLTAEGVSVPAGSCPTVGISGLTLGGGVGVVTRAYGILSDNLRSVDVVTADGKVLTCNSTANSDLFWACRGGGGATFGVATSFTFATHPADHLVVFFLSWPWAAARSVIDAWQHWAPTAPDELWSNLHALNGQSQSAPTIQVGGTYVGAQSDAQRLINTLTAKIGTGPSSQVIETTGYGHAMMLEAGCTQLSTGECHLHGSLPGRTTDGQLAREAEYAASHIFTRPLPGAGIDAILAAVKRRGVLPGGGQGGIAFDALGGAVNRIAPDATAFVHRDGLFTAQFTTTWTTSAPTSQTSAQQAWLRSFHSALTPYASGQAYQNYADAGLTNWQQAYFGANYPRLLQVKNRYDPDRVFRQPQTAGA